MEDGERERENPIKYMPEGRGKVILEREKRRVGFRLRLRVRAPTHINKTANQLQNASPLSLLLQNRAYSAEQTSLSQSVILNGRLEGEMGRGVLRR